MTRGEQYTLILELARRNEGKILHREQLAGIMEAVGELDTLATRLGFAARYQGPLRGVVVQMLTGEGKTLVEAGGALKHGLDIRARYGHDVLGMGAHVITHNAKLAGDALVTYDRLGAPINMKGGWLKPDEGAQLGGDGIGKFDQPVAKVESTTDVAVRRAQYEQPATFGSVNEFVFDSLRDAERAKRGEDPVQQGHEIAIGDEIDALVLDMGRTRLRLARSLEADLGRVDDWNTAVRLAGELTKLEAKPGELYTVTGGRVRIARSQWRQVQDRLGRELTATERADVVQVMQASYQLRLHNEYFIDGTKVVPINRETGWPMPEQRWDSHHQALEALHDLPVRPRQEVIAETTIAQYLANYNRVAGFTGTAGEASVLARLYGLRIVQITPVKPRQLRFLDAEIWGSADALWEALINESKQRQQNGELRPGLRFLDSVRSSEAFSAQLAEALGIEPNVLNALPRTRRVREAGHRPGRTKGRRVGGHRLRRPRYRHQARWRPGHPPRGTQRKRSGTGGRTRRGHRAPAGCEWRCSTCPRLGAPSSRCSAAAAARANRPPASYVSRCPS
ncbi:MAG: hypothetical protein WKF82_02810 [Nocardioidaceae bacterium]